MAAIVLALGLLLGSALADPPKPTPDSPGVNYWYLHVDGPGPQVGDMDPGLREIADAFGRGDYGTCRRLASTLLDSAKDPTLRAEAAGFVVQSHLAEGDFASARAAARRLEEQESLAGISGTDAEYKAEVGRLQRIVATTKDPAEAARAQLWTARAHQRAGRWELAEQSYGKVVQRYPSSAEAGAAFPRVVLPVWDTGDREATRALCEWAIDVAPDDPLGVRACEMLFRYFAEPPSMSQEGMRQRLRALAARHPGTGVADMVRFGIGQLYLAEGVREATEAEWAALAVERTGQMAPELERGTRLALAHLRYDRAMAANSKGDLEAATRAMELVVNEPAWDRSLQGPLFLLADWYETQGKHDDAIRIRRKLLLLCKTKEDELGTSIRIAVSLREAGKSEEALRVLEGVLRESPPEYLAMQCREQIELIRDPAEMPEDESASAAVPQ